MAVMILFLLSLAQAQKPAAAPGGPKPGPGKELADPKSSVNKSLADGDFARRCGVSKKNVRTRYFFKEGSEANWREYPDAKLVPEAGLADAVMTAFGGNGGPLYTVTKTPGEDIGVFQFDCYSASGELRFLELQVDSQSGWTYFDAQSYANGSVSKESSRFEETQSKIVTPRPQGADGVAEFLKPTVYKQIGQAPFGGLLKRGKQGKK